MLSDTFKSARARTTALVIAFGVVAGGVALTAAPSFAAPGEEAAVSAGGAAASVASETISPDAASVAVSGAGFTPGNLVYVQVTGPGGETNWSWGTESHEADASGAVSAELTSAEPWAEGEYSVVLFESDDVNAPASFVVAAAPATTTPAPTSSETASAAPTATETTTPTATATETTSATPTETPTPTPTETSSPTPTATESATPTESASVAPTVTETATPSPTVTEAPVVIAAVATERASYTQAEAAEGITYVATGFTPGVELGLTLQLPDGSTAPFESTEKIIPDADGNYAGEISYSAEWPVGEYGITLTSISSSVGEETDEVATDDQGAEGAVPLIVEGEQALVAPADASPTAGPGVEAAIAEEQTASTTFGVTGEAGAGGAPLTPSASAAPSASTGGGSHAQNKSLATTGAEDAFGAAGIGLLVLGIGAAAVTGARFLSRRRES